jgi:hypothetical protein
MRNDAGGSLALVGHRGAFPVKHAENANGRSTAFGLFDTGFGIAWLAGSIALGVLYQQSLKALVAVSIVTQLLAIPFFVVANLRSGRMEKQQ